MAILKLMLLYCSKLVNVSCRKCKFIFETIRPWQKDGEICPL